MGLGPFPDVGLADARSEARKWRNVVRSGGDAVKARDAEQREAAKARPTLEAVFLECFESRRAELKNNGAGWDYPVRVHIIPTLGKVPIEELDQNDVASVLRPIWHDKPDAARKAALRLGMTLKHGAAMGLAVDLMAVEKAKALLGKRRHKPIHVPAMPWREVPGFYKSLGGSSTELALRLIVLTGCRSGEVRGAHLTEFDLIDSTWEIPAARMKMGSEFRVPLSDEAMKVVHLASRVVRNGYLFPSPRGDKPLSDMAFTSWFKRREMVERAHGFRSSLRDWIAETTDAPREVAELCLAHEVGGKVETAYRRTDFLEQRRALMGRWADHVTGGTDAILRLTKDGH